MEPTHRPEPEERDAPLERREEDDAMRYPGHEDPERAREKVGLDKDRTPVPEGAPLPEEPDRGRPAPLDE